MKFDVELYAAWRRDDPTRPLPREVEEHMVLEIVRLQEEVQAERAAVVALMRDEERLHEKHGSLTVASSLRHLGDIIECGEHRREEEP